MPVVSAGLSITQGTPISERCLYKELNRYIAGVPHLHTHLLLFETPALFDGSNCDDTIIELYIQSQFFYDSCVWGKWSFSQCVSHNQQFSLGFWLGCQNYLISPGVGPEGLSQTEVSCILLFHTTLYGCYLQC